MDHKQAEKYRGAILYNSEGKLQHSQLAFKASFDHFLEDIHFPTLTVGQTLAAVARNRVLRHHQESGSGSEHVSETLDVVTKALGIAHTRQTLVGNEFVRGVSGGERKRVSLGEIMAAQVCFLSSQGSKRQRF
jgi:ATP-binding cassette subfamily G (WHITE) protein 2 (SNQ2)